MSDPSLIAQLQRWARDIPHYPALRDRGPDGQSWETLSWLAYWERVQALARGLLSLGLEPGDCVALVGDNRSAWVLSELAIMCCGGIPAPIYTTNTAEQVGFILEHSQCTIAIGDGEEQLQKLQTAQGLADTRLQHLLSFEEPSLKGAQSLSSLIEAAGEGHRDLLQERIESLDPDRTALLIYTSGTTGTPKAVQLGKATLHRSLEFLPDPGDTQEGRRTHLREVVLQLLEVGAEVDRPAEVEVHKA